jgi:hypothetical protein
MKTAAGGRRLRDACLPKKVLIDNQQDGKENFSDFRGSPTLSDAPNAKCIGQEGELFRSFGRLCDWMNREGHIQHLIARSRFIPLGARLDSEKHAA